MTFEYSAKELGLDEKISPKFLDIRRLRPLDKNQPWGIFFIAFDETKLPVVALRRLLSKLALTKRSTSNTGEHASWHANDLLLISQTGSNDGKSISFAHFASNPEKKDLPILKVLGWDSYDTGLKIEHVIDTLREKLIWPDDPSNSEAWKDQWSEAFTLKNREVIQTSEEMAVRLGQLALAIRNRIRELLKIENEDGPIHKLMDVFKDNLIADLSADDFSDMYAQTITYGLLSARIVNPKANTSDAAITEIPITSPFLRELMEEFLIAGGRNKSSSINLDFDELGINDVVELLDNNINMEAVLRDFGDRNQKEDPVMHFFEGFLKEYDPKRKNERGVFYTPQPVVSFIVRSVDEELRSKFQLEDGLADISTWGEIKRRIPNIEIPEDTSSDDLFIQILDPATGTGTFPVEVIDLIYKTMMDKWKLQGLKQDDINLLWNEYVPKYLLPRVHGYELMMAPYAITHMKIGLKLYETGYKFASPERARIYLTNSLEPSQDSLGTFDFAIPSLAHEARQVNEVKKAMRFTVILGNPPYSGRSWNLTPQLKKIVEPYHYIDGVKIKEKGALQLEKSIQEDYIKFLRNAEVLLEKSSIGVLGFVTSNGFLDNPTLRGMRNSFLKSFNYLNIIDMHGNVSRREVAPDGGIDENVFDIKKVGVAISILLKDPSVDHTNPVIYDLWGERENKYKWLSENTSSVSQSITINPLKPHYLFVYEDLEAIEEYETGYSIQKILPLYSSGVVTGRDAFISDFDTDPLLSRMADFVDPKYSDGDLVDKFNLNPTDWWPVDIARKEMPPIEDHKDFIRDTLYRPFDKRVCFYHSSVFMSPRNPVMKQKGPNGKNFFLITSRMTKGESFAHATISEGLVDKGVLSSKTSNSAMIFPLYRDNNFSDTQSLEFDFNQGWISTFEKSFLKEVQSSIDMKYIEEPKGDLFKTFGPEDLLNYVFSILHSPTYRLKYQEFLKRDFPKIPLPSSKSLFSELISHGESLISFHLLKNHFNKKLIKKIGSGAFLVEKVLYSDETIWINSEKSQGFSGVSIEVWNFHIGGYKVSEKWLKDRQEKGGRNPRPGRVLCESDISEYQKILITIDEILTTMEKIDEVIRAHGDWPDAFKN